MEEGNHCPDSPYAAVNEIRSALVNRVCQPESNDNTDYCVTKLSKFRLHLTPTYMYKAPVWVTSIVIL